LTLTLTLTRPRTRTRTPTRSVAGLRKRFGRTQALDGMSFTVRPGQVTGFVGPNGAGKSNLGNWQFFAGVRCFLPLNGEPTG
jgi:ABC-type sugar transport system ATPase subunit